MVDRATSQTIVINGHEFDADFESEDARRLLFTASMSVLASSPVILKAIDAVLGEGAWLTLFGDDDGYAVFQAVNLIGSLVVAAGVDDEPSAGE